MRASINLNGSGSQHGQPIRPTFPVPASPNPAPHSSLPSLQDALMTDAPGVTLLFNPEGQVISASSLATAVWPGLLEGTRALPNFIGTDLANEWMEHIRNVSRTSHPVAIRGIVRGEWLWLTLRAVHVSPDTVGVLATVRPLVQDSTQHPPLGLPGGMQVVNAEHSDLGTLGNLSPKEIEILSLISTGLTTGQIAKCMHRSLKTVENHRTSIGRKLNAASLLELYRIAHRAGMPATAPLFAERTRQP